MKALPFFLVLVEITIDGYEKHSKWLVQAADHAQARLKAFSSEAQGELVDISDDNLSCTDSVNDFAYRAIGSKELTAEQADIYRKIAWIDPYDA